MTSAAEARAAQMFAIDMLTGDAPAEMTVRHSDGLYRHLRFRRGDTSLYWFDLITWPGTLTFHGDMGTWVFSRIEDMTRFFAGQRINPGYWAEKVKAGEVRRYDPERFREHVEEAIQSAVEAGEFLPYQLAALRKAVERDVLNDEIPDYEHTARQAVRDFVWNGWTFGPDTWEWDLQGFTHHFLYACFALQWGVNRYLGLPQPDLSDLTATLHPAPPAPSRTPSGPVTTTPRPEFL